MLPAIIPLVQIGVGLLSAYGAFNYVQEHYMTYNGSIQNYWALKQDLLNNVFGQSAPLLELTNFISEKPGPGAHAMFIIGGPGVGKTLTTTLIKKHYEPKELIVQIIPSLQPLNEETLNRTQKIIHWVTKGYSLIIIDSVAVDDLQYLVNFVKRLDMFCHAKKLEARIFAVGTILKTHSSQANEKAADSFKDLLEYEDFVKSSKSSIKTFLTKRYANFRVIALEPLTPFVVKKCVKKALDNLYLRSYPSDSTIDSVVYDVCESHFDFAPSGCKDVDAYVLPFAS